MACSEREALMAKIHMVGFAIDDVILFLDTHPSNADALAFYDRNRIMYQKLTDEYTTKYGPLTIYDVKPCNKWAWTQSSWPWEGEE